MPTEAAPYPKDPRFADHGRAGARKRWGGRRIVRLDRLDPPVREAVLALVAADEAAKAAAKAAEAAAPADEPRP